MPGRTGKQCRERYNKANNIDIIITSTRKYHELNGQKNKNKICTHYMMRLGTNGQ